MNKFIKVLLLATTLGLTIKFTYGATYNYSYTFGDGTKLSGSLDGDPSTDGLYVQNVHNVTVFFNGTSMSGTILTDRYTGNFPTPWEPGSVVSFNADLNNFLFANNLTFDDEFFLISHGSESSSVAQTYSGRLGYYYLDRPTIFGNWSLTLAQNQPPVANNQSVTTSPDTPKDITLTANDPDNGPNALTYSIVTGPAHGTLTGTPPNVTYTPASGYTGSDQFTFKANDGAEDSNIAAVTVGVGTPKITVTDAHGNELTKLSFVDRLVIPPAIETKLIIITNSGSGPLRLSLIHIIGTYADQFKVAFSGALTIPPNANQVVPITFQPTSLGRKTATLEIIHNAQSPDPLDIPLDGGQDVDIHMVSATTADSQSVTFSYEIAGGTVPQFVIGVYRSSTPQFDAATAIPVGSALIQNASPGPYTGTLPVSLGIDPSHRYVVVVADPDGTVAETNEDNNTASFRKYVIGAVTHGLEPDGNFPVWVTQMSTQLVSLGYDATVPFDWADMSFEPIPGQTELASYNLAFHIRSTGASLAPMQKLIPIYSREKRVIPLG